MSYVGLESEACGTPLLPLPQPDGIDPMSEPPSASREEEKIKTVKQ